MNKILDMQFIYDYVIKPKARPQANFRNKSFRNPTKEHEDTINRDTSILLTHMDKGMNINLKDKIKALKENKKICVEIELTNIYSTPTKKLWDTPKLTRPDIDNVLKTWMDAHNDYLYLDDNVIYKTTAIKLWGPENKAKVKIKYYQL